MLGALNPRQLAAVALANSKNRTGLIPFQAVSDVAAGAILYITGMVANTDHVSMDNADADAAASAENLLYVARYAAVSGTYGEAVPMLLLSTVNTSGAAVGDPVYLSGTAGGWTLTKPDRAIKVGEVITVSATVGQVLLMPQAAQAALSPRNLAANLAAGTVITNTATETDESITYTIPANTLKAGSRIRIKAVTTMVATNGTDTYQKKLYIGGTARAATGALDVANGDVATIDYEFEVRAAPGATVATVGSGSTSIGTPGTAAKLAADSAGPFNLATNGAIIIKCTSKWSVADPGNQARPELLLVDIIP